VLKFNLTVPDEFSDVRGRLLVKAVDNTMADGQIINSGGVYLLLLCNYAVIFCGFSSVLVNFSASSYDVGVNDTLAIVRVQAFGEFRDPFLVNVTTSAQEIAERGMNILTHLHHMHR